MGSIYLRKYGVATTVDFCLYELDGTDLQVGAAHAAGDIAMMKDEGNEAAPAAGFTDEGTGYSLALSATEMEAARIVIYIVDQTSPKAWLDKILIIETYGNASAQHAFDLATSTVNLSATSEAQIDAIETDTNEIQGKLPTNKFMGSSGVTDKDDEIDAIKAKTDLIPADITTQLDTNVPAIKTMTDKIGTVTNTSGTATIGAILGDVANSAVAVRLTTLDTIIDNIHDTDLPDVHTDVADVHTDVGTAITNIGTVSGYVDTEVAAIKAVTDTLSLAAIADAIHDETTETGITLRKAVNIMLAALAGKSTGGGTSALAFRDQANSKNRINATVDSDGNRTAITNDGT